MPRVIEVWVCLKCGNYYAASSIAGKDLSQEMNLDLKSNPTFSRDCCQTCDPNGSVKRVRRSAVVLDHDLTPKEVERVDQVELVQLAYEQLRRAGHESVR